MLAGVGIALLLAFKERALQSPVVFVTIAAFAGAGLLAGFSRRKVKQA